MFQNPEFVKFAGTYAPYAIVCTLLIVTVIAAIVSKLKIKEKSLPHSMIVGYTVALHVLFIALGGFYFILTNHAFRELAGAILPAIDEAFFTYFSIIVFASLIANSTLSLLHIKNSNSASLLTIFNLFGGMVMYPILFMQAIFISMYIV